MEKENKNDQNREIRLVVKQHGNSENNKNILFPPKMK